MRRFPLLLFVLISGLFAFGLFELFRLRFEAGDVYPEYSSLRADPLGTMALYESLAQLPGLTIHRDFKADNRLPDGRDTTYLHLAASRLEWSLIDEDALKEIDGFLARGGRLAITFMPEDSQPSRWTPPPAATAPGQKKQGQKARSQQEHRRPHVSLKDRWGVELAVLPLETGSNASHHPARALNQADLPLPQELAWHSGLIFTNLPPSWRTIYARGDHPVLIERGVGAGSLVMATDSYFLSNEALSKEHVAGLLAWFVGPSKRVVFDEAHFGLVENPGTAALMRKYRLHGLAAGLILLAGLFIWKNSMSFLPPYPDEQEAGQVAGKEAAAGFVNLLRRNIAPRDVLRVCFDEWTRSLLHGGNSHLIARVDQAQTVLEGESGRARTEQDPVRAYREICQALAGKAGEAPIKTDGPPTHASGIT